MHPIIKGGGNSIWDRPYHKTLLQINYNKRMVETTPQRCHKMTYKFWMRVTYNDSKSVRFPSSFGSVPDNALMPKLLIY